MAKSLEEKITEIKESLEQEEISRREFNSPADSRAAKRILDGKKVMESTVDRLLAKIYKIRDKRKKESKNPVKIPLGVKEIEIEKVIENKGREQRNAGVCGIDNSIKEHADVIENSSTAFEKKLIASLKIENGRLKEEISFLKGEIEQRDQENRQLREESKTVIETSNTVVDKRQDVTEAVNRHDQIIKEVISRIENLEQQIVIERSITCKDRNPAHHGFTVCQLASGYWQAVRRINGRPQCVYIGRNLSLAQEKIEKWLGKYCPELLTQNT